jgi:hypothetical protein
MVPAMSPLPRPFPTLGPAVVCGAVLCTALAADRTEAAPPPTVKPAAVAWTRYVDKTERAFSLTVPKGWLTRGGIVRVNPLTGGGAGNAIAAKVDFTVARDAAGSVAIRWLPDMNYFDSRMSPAGQMGLFPRGSNYNGMEVQPSVSAAQYLTGMVFPRLHPRARATRILQTDPMPAVQALCQKSPLLKYGFKYDVAMVTVVYEENGVRYAERLFTVIEHMGQLGAGAWGNKSTIAARVPVGEAKAWEPVVRKIIDSVKIETKWLLGELRGQLQRGQTASDTMKAIAKIDREIVANRQKVNSAINKGMYLTLTGQDEYVNPHTGKAEIDADRAKYRWQDASGRTFDTDDPNYDPNRDPERKSTGWKRSARKR